MPASKPNPNDSLQNGNIDVAQNNYNDRVSRNLANTESDGTFSPDTSNDNSSDSENVRNRENNGDPTPSGGWANNTGGVGGSNFKQPKTNKAIAFAKKRGGLIGLFALLGIGGGIIAGFLGPASMLISVMENTVLANDSSSTAMERRLIKVFGNMTSDNTICANSTKLSMKCRAGRISHSALNKLAKQGITPIDSDGIDTKKKTGYPKKNPSAYMFDLGDDKGPVKVMAADLTKYLGENPKLAAKVLGHRGAFNLRYKAWSSKYLSNKFFNKFSINKTGGIADGTNKKVPAGERFKTSLEKMRSSIPGFDTVNNIPDKISAKVKGNLSKGGKGGAAYVIAMSGCVALKTPKYIAAGVAAVQLARILPVINDVVLSPGSKAKASGVDTASSITSDDIEAVATLLTERTPRESDGKLTSALDSPHLQAAMGINTNKAPVSQSFAPGLATLISFKGALDLEKTTAPGCDVILSPAAMYSAMAVDAALTAALSATVVGGLIKIAAGAAVSWIVTEAAGKIVGDIAQLSIEELAKNEDLDLAQGEAFGDVLGISASSFFASSGMSRHLPTLKESQVMAYQQVKTDSENLQRDIEIASLSPFDTSSKYTFLGSIAHNMQLAVISSGASGNLFSTIASLTKFPVLSLSNNVGASSNMMGMCSYAEDFGFDKGPDTPAINSAGLPCTGLLPEQASMSTNEAIDYMISEKWLNEDIDIPDDATIDTLMSIGYIKEDTPLREFIESCSDPISGDYLFNSAGCTVESSASNGGISGNIGNDLQLPTSEGESVSIGSIENDLAGNTDYLSSSSRALQAMSVFLLDFQVLQSVNGEDEDDFASYNDTSIASDYVLPVDEGYNAFNDAQDWGSRDICSGGANSYCKFHRGVDFTFSSSKGRPVYSIAAGEVIESLRGNPTCSATTSGNVNMDNRVLIKHADGAVSGYSHMSIQSIDEAGIKVGAKVTAGQKIGTIDNCGNSQGAHLHFTINPGSTSIPSVLALDSNTNGEKFLDPVGYMRIYGIDLITGKKTTSQ